MFSSTLYSSQIVYSTARGLSWFFPLLWVFHVIFCVSILLSVLCVDFVHTSSFRLWLNELGNQILSIFLSVFSYFSLLSSSSFAAVFASFSMIIFLLLLASSCFFSFLLSVPSFSIHFILLPNHCLHSGD